MTQKKKIILRLLQVFSQFKPGFILNDSKLIIINRKKALDALQSNSIDFLIPYACDIEDDIRDIFLQNNLDQMIFQIRVLKELDKIISILSRENIQLFLLKGFAMRRYYPPECIRPISDIDIVVHPDERYRCVNIFRDSGYQLASGIDVEHMLTFHGELSWKNPQTQISVECHWDLINAASMRKVTNFDPSFIFGKLEMFDVDGVSINVLPMAIELAYLMTHHVLHHQFNRILWLADVLLIMSEEIDWKEFEDAVKRLRMDRPVYYYLSALIKLFEGEDLANILELKYKLMPRSMRYYFFSGFKRPENIFKREQSISRLRDQIFRNAFK